MAAFQEHADGGELERRGIRALAEIFQGLFRLVETQRKVDEAQAYILLGDLELEQLFVDGAGLVPLLLLFVGIGQFHQGLDKVRHGLDGLLEQRDGFRTALHPDQGPGMVIIHHGRPFTGSDTADVLFRLIESFGLDQQQDQLHAGIQGVGMPRHEGPDLLQALFRLAVGRQGLGAEQIEGQIVGPDLQAQLQQGQHLFRTAAVQPQGAFQPGLGRQGAAGHLLGRLQEQFFILVGKGLHIKEIGVGILGGRRKLFFLGQDLDALERGRSGPAPGLGGGTAAASQQGKGQRTAPMWKMLSSSSVRSLAMRSSRAYRGKCRMLPASP